MTSINTNFLLPSELNSVLLNTGSINFSLPSELPIPRDLFFRRHISLVEYELTHLPNEALSKDVALIIANFVTSENDCFGAQEYKRYFGVDVDMEPVLTHQFYNF